MIRRYWNRLRTWCGYPPPQMKITFYQKVTPPPPAAAPETSATIDGAAAEARRQAERQIADAFRAGVITTASGQSFAVRWSGDIRLKPAQDTLAPWREVMEREGARL